jgi:hypothetical protein
MASGRYQRDLDRRASRFVLTLFVLAGSGFGALGWAGAGASAFAARMA